MADDTETGLSQAQCRVLVDFNDDSMVHDSIMFVTDNSQEEFAYRPDFINGIRAGDVVVGLLGYKLPFVLRKAETCSKYQMVNLAYVNEHVLGHHMLGITAEMLEYPIRSHLEQYGLQEYTIM